MSLRLKAFSTVPTSKSIAFSQADDKRINRSMTCFFILTEHPKPRLFFYLYSVNQLFCVESLTR